jgi:arylsulfatase A-like enzyme
MNHLRERDLLAAYVEDMTDRLYSDRPVSNFATTRPAPIPDDAYVDNWVGRHGLDRLEAAPEDRPWFLMVNFVGPHEPMDVTQSMHELYRDPDVHFPAPVDPAGNLDADTHQEIRRNYAAMCETIDEWLGRYQETLRERGEWEDTIVIFASDHGDLLGDHGGWTKKSPRRASSGVPLAVGGPEVESLGAVDDPVTLLDIHATVCDYANVEFENVDSRSLRPFLEGTGDPPRHAVRSGLHATDERPWWRMVFDGRFELIIGENLEAVDGMTGYTSPVLFDLETDPNETTDIAPQEPEIIERLGSHLPDGIHPE